MAWVWTAPYYDSMFCSACVDLCFGFASVRINSAELRFLNFMRLRVSRNNLYDIYMGCVSVQVYIVY